MAQSHALTSKEPSLRPCGASWNSRPIHVPFFRPHTGPRNCSTPTRPRSMRTTLSPMRMTGFLGASGAAAAAAGTETEPSAPPALASAAAAAAAAPPAPAPAPAPPAPPAAPSSPSPAGLLAWAMAWKASCSCRQREGALGMSALPPAAAAPAPAAPALAPPAAEPREGGLPFLAAAFSAASCSFLKASNSVPLMRISAAVGGAFLLRLADSCRCQQAEGNGRWTIGRDGRRKGGHGE